MNRKLFVSLAISTLFVLLVVMFASCSGDDIIKVGTILGLTGNYAAYGQKMQRGFEFALDEINSAGGINGKRIQLITEDSQFDPTRAVTAYRKLNGAEGIQIIVGITGSKNALAVCEASKADNIVIVDALGSAPKLTTHGGPNYFRIMASDAFAGQYNVDWAMEGGMKQPVIVYVEDDWGASYRDAILLYLEKRGFTNVPAHGVTAGTRDFRIQIQKIKGESPDAIFLLLYAKEGAVFMQQLRQAGIQAAVYGSDNISSPEFVSAGNEVVEGVRVAMPAPVSGPLYNEFVAKYKAKYNEEPDANVIKSYDAIKLVAKAIQHDGKDPSKIKEYLRSPDFEYRGVSGPIKFDSNGDLVSQEYTRLVYHSGKLVPLGQTK